MNESRLANVLVEKLVSFPMTVTRQKVEGSRYNILAKSPGEPNLLLAAHMDTVEPSDPTQLKPFVDRGRLYGLGSCDTKGGLCAIIEALRIIGNDELKKVRGLSILFYCDEEYDFLGTKKFIEEVDSVGKLAVLAEPTDLEILYAHRGIIEVHFSITGERAHASRPFEGKHAINACTDAVGYLTTEVGRYKTWIGEPTVNLAYLHGGLLIKQGDLFEVELGRQGNNIPNYAEAVLDIRTPSHELNATKTKNIIESRIIPTGCQIGKFRIRHDLGILDNDVNDLTIVSKIVESVCGSAVFKDPSFLGYSDAQMIRAKYGVSSINFGPIGGNLHNEGEWVDVASLDKVANVYAELIREYCL